MVDKDLMDIYCSFIFTASLTSLMDGSSKYGGNEKNIRTLDITLYNKSLISE